MKHFETVLGTELRAWGVSDTLTITKKADTVLVTTKLEDGRVSKTVFNLSVLPMYTFIA